MNLTECDERGADCKDRRASDASKSSLGAVSMDDENPLMTLVDAAASILGTKVARREVSVPGSPLGPQINVCSDAKASGLTVKESPNVIPGTKEDLFGSSSIKLTFAEQLFDILQNEENHDVLQWMPDGCSFIIVNHKKFILDKMPKLFNIRNMSSFVRKLGRWGFSRVHEKATRNSDIFKHPFFVREMREECRKKVKCIGRIPSSSNSKPSVGQVNGVPYKQHLYSVLHDRHLDDVCPRYGDRSDVPRSTSQPMSNLSEGSRSSLYRDDLLPSQGVHLTQSSPNRVTFLDEHLHRVLPELPFSNKSLLPSGLPAHLPLFNKSKNSDLQYRGKEGVFVKASATSETSAAALFSQYEKQLQEHQIKRSSLASQLSQQSAYEEARWLSELDHQLAEQQVALEQRRVALEQQRIIKQRQVLMEQRQAMEKRFGGQVFDPRYSQATKGTGSLQEESRGNDNLTSSIADNLQRGRDGVCFTPNMSRKEAIRALLWEERELGFTGGRR